MPENGDTLRAAVSSGRAPSVADCGQDPQYDQSGCLARRLPAVSGSKNADGDAQKDLDIFADDMFLEAMRQAPVALYGSEELAHPALLDASAPLALAIDPLDGSSNIDTNVSIGTIFSILPVVGQPDSEPGASFFQKGERQLAAGFFIYGPQLALVLTLGSGTHVFVFSSRLRYFRSGL